MLLSRGHLGFALMFQPLWGMMFIDRSLANGWFSLGQQLLV